MKNKSSYDRQRYYRAYYQEYKHRTKRVKCTLTRSEYMEMARHANKAGMKLTPFIKKAAMAYVRQEYIVPENQAEDLRKLVLLLRGIGNNLNQLAARSNTFKNTTMLDLMKAKKNLHNLETIIKKFVRNPTKQTQSDDSEINEQKNSKLRTTT